jgi:cell division protein ZapD
MAATVARPSNDCCADRADTTGSGSRNPRGAFVSTLLIFEHPLNERVRTFLRIEHLFERLNYFAPQYDPWATRVAVEALLDLASITARADIKNEIVKELDRNIATIKRIADQPGIDQRALDRVLAIFGCRMAAVNRLTPDRSDRSPARTTF